MKKLFFLLCLFPMLASAEHHRGHAIGHAEAVKIHLNAVASMLAQFKACCSPLTEDQQAKADHLDHYIVAQNRRFDSVLTQLEDTLTPASQLEAIRRQLNDPNMPANNSASASATWYAMQSSAHRLIQAAPNGYGTDRMLYLYILEQHLTNGWKRSDATLWHINDAIREEIYLNPEFQ